MDGTPMLTEIAAEPPGTEVGYLGPDDGKELLGISAGAAAEDDRPAPSPNNVVVASGHWSRKAREQARAQEAVLRAEYAAEIARLTRLLRETRRAHAADLDRLRAEHAAKLRHVIEAQWRARDAVRATGEPGSPAKTAAHAPRARAPAARLILPEWLARLVGRTDRA